MRSDQAVAVDVLPRMKVLLAEDDPKIRSLVEKGLAAEGMVVDAVADGLEALALAQSRPYDAVILDIMLPGQDGLAVLRSLRRGGANLPVLLVTARGALEQRVEGLDAGADDYLPKPFHIDELAARLRAVARRTQGEQLNLRGHGPIRLNLATRGVQVAGQGVELTAREFALLELLLRSPGRVYTRAQILDYVWNYHFDPGTNVVDVYVRRLREKLGPAAATLIEAVRGVGYRLRSVGLEGATLGDPR